MTSLEHVRSWHSTRNDMECWRRIPVSGTVLLSPNVLRCTMHILPHYDTLNMRVPIARKFPPYRMHIFYSIRNKTGSPTIFHTPYKYTGVLVPAYDTCIWPPSKEMK